MRLTPLQRILVAGVALSHATVWWRAVRWFPELPERIPVHFDAAGSPDAWVAKAWLPWFALPLVDTGMVVLFGAITALAGKLSERHPGWCNMPKKRLFVALSPAGRRQAMGPTRTFLLGMLLLLAALFCWVVEGTARVALGQQRALAPWPVFVFVGAVLGMLVPYYVATSRRITSLAQAEGIALKG